MNHGFQSVWEVIANIAIPGDPTHPRVPRIVLHMNQGVMIHRSCKYVASGVSTKIRDAAKSQ